ncbi:Crp/Fnr family transcriptional regulator [Mycobacterium deserti]|uniref:Crp/Fnr family transcriptional regulator n=1 Tax=Mycobacterium deserti TaxID=2978347 RepID=A0ABT2MCY3_9MYCO|nr:Crp/Fnr family transcriptional regulator [Mycobacterium deserti]MCT7660124.1 Crp/Fnr family transcriptional regulator [Mycobacterium deserti]
MNSTAADVLAHVGFLRGLDPAIYSTLAPQLRLEEWRRGKDVYRQDEFADGLHIILRGKVKVCSRAVDGREKLMEIRGPSDVLGTVSALDRGPRTATATAVTDVCTAVVDDETLHRWMSERPEIAAQLLKYMAKRLRSANNHLLAMVFDDVPCRVAKELLHLARRFGSQHGEFLRVRHDLTQTELAQLVGATRESVNKALCDFVNRGWITTDGKITMINQPHLLARRAG